MGVMQQDGTPVIVAIRLQVQGGRIIEAEHLVAAINGADNLARLQVPRAGLTTEVLADKRLPHDELVKSGASCYDSPSGWENRASSELLRGLRRPAPSAATCS